MVFKKLEIDEDLVRQLATIQCTMVEIGAVVKCSVDTLERRFADVIKKGQEEGKSSLRRAQYKIAMSGNSTMLIWLGKQYLNQRDSAEINVAPETKQAFTKLMGQFGVEQEKRKEDKANVQPDRIIEQEAEIIDPAMSNPITE